MEDNIKKLLYRSWHRGCKETDILFGKFAKANLEYMSKQEIFDYQRLLDVDDVYLYNWLAGLEEIPEEYNTPIMQKVIKFNHQVSHGKAV